MFRQRALKVVLLLVGLLFLAGAYPLITSLRHASHPGYDAMMLSLYVTLGIFVLRAVRNPSAHRSLIAFTAWSSFGHATVMAIQAFQFPSDRAELLFGVALFGVIGLAVALLAPAKQAERRPSAAVAA